MKLLLLRGTLAFAIASTLIVGFTTVQAAPGRPPAARSEGAIPRDGVVDQRVRTIVYRPDEVVRIRGAYGYAMAIEFAEDESIEALSAGDSVGWQVVSRKNVLFLKPQDDQADTNLLVHTSRRTYSFSLSAFMPSGSGDSRLSYRVRFRYPEDEARKAMEAEAEKAKLARTVVGAAPGGAPGPGGPSGTAKLPSAWNFNYTFKGAKGAAPVQMLDDGQFTYVRFASTESLPAIFHVDSDGQETLINYRREGEWLVIERIARRFTFRANNNADVACIYNNGYPTREPTLLKEQL